jgi:hypothetical protein
VLPIIAQLRAAEAVHSLTALFPDGRMQPCRLFIRGGAETPERGLTQLIRDGMGSFGGESILRVTWLVKLISAGGASCAQPSEGHHFYVSGITLEDLGRRVSL